jgi:hypothetical protein
MTAEAFTQRLKLLAQATTEDAAAELCRAFPGKRLYIPMDIPERHPISELIGYDQAKKLASAYGGFSIELPTGAGIRQYQRDQEIVAAYSDGTHGVTELAAQHQLSPRHIMRIIKTNTDRERASQ